MNPGNAKENPRTFPLSDELAEADLRVSRLLEQQHLNPADAVLPEALQELSTALEELRVADEELRQQNEILISTQHQTKVERQRYQDLFEFAPDGYLVTNLNGAILEANRAVSQMLSVVPKFLVGKPIVVLMHKRYYKEIHHQLSLIPTNPDGFTAEVTFKPRRGPDIDVSLKVGAIFDSKGAPEHLLWQLRDVTERNRILDALRQTEEENRQKTLEVMSFNRRLFETQEQERRNVARELHDEIGQSLTGLKLTLAAIKSDTAAEREVALANGLEAVDQLIRQVRNLALELRPAMLDDLGLVPALLWQFKRYTQQTGVEVKFSHSNCELRMGADVETAAYRIIQEALTNAARYAKVSEARVYIYVYKATLFLEVEDSGIGFDWRAANAARQSTGLSGMMERATLVGGQVHIQSSSNAGCLIRASLPIGKDAQDD